jgi:hypothetical protein
MPTVKEEKPAIDPTVPLPIRAELVKTAEWHYQEEVHQNQGLERRIPRRYPKVNGIVFNEMTPPAAWRRVLEWYPKVPVMLPENDDEREKRITSGKYRAAEVIIWNGVVFTMPKGIPVMVPEPIAKVVENANEIYRTTEVRKEIERMIQETGSAGT